MPGLALPHDSYLVHFDYFYFLKMDYFALLKISKQNVSYFQLCHVHNISKGAIDCASNFQLLQFTAILLTRVCNLSINNK